MTIKFVKKNYMKGNSFASMVNNDLEIDADELTNVCFKAYEKNIENKNKLGKNEWTNVAAIVLFDNNRKGERV